MMNYDADDVKLTGMTPTCSGVGETADPWKSPGGRCGCFLATAMLHAGFTVGDVFSYRFNTIIFVEFIIVVARTRSCHPTCVI